MSRQIVFKNLYLIDKTDFGTPALVVRLYNKALWIRNLRHWNGIPIALEGEIIYRAKLQMPTMPHL